MALATLLSRSLLFSATVAQLSRSTIVRSTAFSIVSSRLRSRVPHTSVTSSTLQRLSFARGGGCGGINSNSNWNLGASSFGDNSAVQDESSVEDEARTGWLHNTEPKEYYTPVYPTFEPSPATSTTSFIEKMNDYRNHRIVTPPAVHSCGENRRVMVTEHKIAVPLRHPDLEAAASAAASGAVDRANGDGESPIETRRTVDVSAGAPRPRAGGAAGGPGPAPASVIVAVDRVDGAYRESGGNANGESPFETRPTIDVYFTVMELISNAADEGFAASLADLAISPRRRAEMYLAQRRGAAPAPVIDASRMVLYLQGGPGFGCSPPVSGLSLASAKSSWASSFLFGDVTNVDGESFERVVLMDQRGTGRSSPISKGRLGKLFPDLFLSDNPEAREGQTLREMQDSIAGVKKAVGEATEYVARFRADSIVRDAEWVKEALLAPPPPRDGASVADDDDESPPRPWGAALGQSFGGFCLMTYLSSVARPPQLCLFTGGIAPMDTPVREVYDRLWLRVKERNWRYYEQYPGDVGAVKRIVRRLLLHDGGDQTRPPVKLPSGGILTGRRFLQMGLGLGGTPGSSFANLHSVISLAFPDDDDDEDLGDAFLKQIDREQSFDDAPLYYLLHESIYADGPRAGATDWAAHTSLRQHGSTNPDLPWEQFKSPDFEFDHRFTSNGDEPSPTLFFGEMVFPWMAAGDYAELGGNGMQSLSKALAGKDDWSPLYDASGMRAALAGGGGDGAASAPRCRAASATYYDDMYVDFNCAMKSVQRGGPLERVKVWVTNEHQHSGLRDDGAAIVCKLVRMAKGSVQVPS